MHFTKEEKTILIAIIIAAVAGIIINFVFSYTKKISEKPAVSAPLLVNINTAPASELDRLPGVGKVIAERIIEYRKLNGAFNSAGELIKVKGISGRKLEAIKRFIIVSPESGIRSPESKTREKSK